MIDQRDEALGHALRALDVPDHGPDFFVRLSERLGGEPPGATAQHPRRLRPPRLTLMAIAAVVIALVGVSTQLGGTEGPPPGPRLITAAEVRERVSVALASLRSLSGEITNECPVCPITAGPTRRWSFVTTAAGDQRLTAIGRLDDYAYSAAQRESRRLTDVQLTVNSNVAAGPPDFIAPPQLRRDIASALQAFPGTAQEVAVTEVVEQGRPAFRLVTPVAPSTMAGVGTSADHIEVAVDRATGFPVRTAEWFGTKLLNEVRLSNLVVNGPVDPAMFTFEAPPDARVFTRDAGFQQMTLGELEAVVGYRPVLPALAGLPPGYVLAEVTVRTMVTPFDHDARNVDAPVLVSVNYRRGFDRITVTTGASGVARRCVPGGHIQCWVDPLASGTGFSDQPEQFIVESGALAGAEGELVISARSSPHVWTVDDRLIVTVAGDANGEELKQIAGSFAPDRPRSTPQQPSVLANVPPTSSPPTSSGCTNLTLTDPVRTALITANGQPGGLLGLAYYGSCGNTSYAMARFGPTADATYQQKVNFQGEGRAPKFFIQEGGTWRLVATVDFMLPQSCACFAELPDALKSLWQNCPAQSGPDQPAPQYAQS